MQKNICFDFAYNNADEQIYRMLEYYIYIIFVDKIRW